MVTNLDIQNYVKSLQENFFRSQERTNYLPICSFIESWALGIRSFVEETGISAGVPDISVRVNDNLVGYIEAKNINKSLHKLNIKDNLQIDKYCNSIIGENLILTNFLDFILYVKGKKKIVATIGYLENNSIIINDNLEDINNLINLFIENQRGSIKSYQSLAYQMAKIAITINQSIAEVLLQETENNLENKFLTKLKNDISNSLLPNLSNDEFSDIYAQTITYGIFASRVYFFDELEQNKSDNKLSFDRAYILTYLKNNPFLSGILYDLIEQKTYIDSSINILIDLLNEADINNIILNFNQEIGDYDIVIYFYENFLQEYSPENKKEKGVFYTPESSVNFIIKSINNILKKDFTLDNGLGSENVNILDPATGTGTFLYGVIKQIYLDFKANFDIKNVDYFFRQIRLLERLYGFELMMTPYIIANLKIGLLLKKLGYIFQPEERINIFLTNTLEKSISTTNFLIPDYISQESEKAFKVKEKTPIYVVLGNPPYLGESYNKGEWIKNLIEDYKYINGQKIDEANPKWLQDDYVKFIRFAQWKLDQVQGGILGYITNYSYITNVTFTAMRYSLAQTFSRIYILNLHGYARQSLSPDGIKDENIFPIQKGVAIIIAVKDVDNLPFRSNHYSAPEKGIFYYDIWGSKEYKLNFLANNNLEQIPWQKVDIEAPYYRFSYIETDLNQEYQKYFRIDEIMPKNNVGIVTANNDFTLNNNLVNMQNIVNDIYCLSEEDFIFKYPHYQEKSNWNFTSAKSDVVKTNKNNNLFTPILKHPFNIKYTYYTGNSQGFHCRPRKEIMSNMLLGENIALLTARKNETLDADHFFCSEYITEAKAGESSTQSYIFPLYIYPDDTDNQLDLGIKKQANFSPKFLEYLNNKLNFLPNPEVIFAYIYSIFYCPQYRKTYGKFFQEDFPRVPIISDVDKFEQLANLGSQLIDLHTLKYFAKKQDKYFYSEFIFSYFGSDTLITKIKYLEGEEKLFINKKTYFYPLCGEIWKMTIGGYRVLSKWLSERKNTVLSQEDMEYFKKVVFSLSQTIKIMNDIDKIVPSFPFL